MIKENMEKFIKCPSGVDVSIDSYGSINITSVVYRNIFVSIRPNSSGLAPKITVFYNNVKVSGIRLQECIFPDKEGDMYTEAIIQASNDLGIEFFHLARRSEISGDPISEISYHYTLGWEFYGIGDLEEYQVS